MQPNGPCRRPWIFDICRISDENAETVDTLTTPAYLPTMIPLGCAGGGLAMPNAFPQGEDDVCI